MTEKQYQELLKKKRRWYKTLTTVFCPVLNSNVVFNAKGFNHLLIDGRGKERNKKDRIYRLELLSLVKPVIKNAESINEYRQVLAKGSGKLVEYWAITAPVGKQRIEVTVILRKIGNGNTAFYSIFTKKPR